MCIRWLLVVFLCLGGLVFQACGMDEEAIKAEIARARACTTDSECVHAASQCPFGCYVVVNEKDAEYIRGLVKGYSSSCQYDCTRLGSILCKNKLCTAITTP